MGNAFGSWFPPGVAKKEGTTLVELTVSHLRDAHGIVGERPNNMFTPLVLVPQGAMSTCCCCCPLFYVSIPEGFSAIVDKFGGIVEGDLPDGTWSSGFHCFGPLKSVRSLVSKQLVVFDTPVRDVKTKDNISVNLDVMILFEIINGKEFVLRTGPAKLDDLLRAAQEESLRQMAMEYLVENIYDLQGSNTKHIAQELNDTKFSNLGVYIHHFTVKNVTIHGEIANDWEEKTLFEPKTNMQHMKQKFDRQKLNNDEGKQKLRDECDNARMAAEQKTEVVKNRAIKETAQVVAQTERDIAELEASRDVEAQQLLTNSELEVSKLKSQILGLEREVKSKTQAETGKIGAEADAFSKQKDTGAKIEVAKKLANGKKALGEAEGVASAAFAARRANESELKRLDILEQMVLKSDRRIATSQENTVGMSHDNAVVTQVAQQGLEAMRAKLAEVTTTSLSKIAAAPRQQAIR